MDFRQLETFVEVVKLKSFSKAAEKLFLTQPTITSHIQNLEKELGTLLLNRSSKNMTPTGAGNLLYHYAIDILNMRNMAEFKLSKYAGSIQGHLEIQSSSIPKQYVLPFILKAFLKRYPDVHVTLSNSDSKQVIDTILEGFTDFGIVGAKYPSKTLDYIELIHDHLILVTPNHDTFPLPSYSEVDMNFLFQQNLILREKGSGSRFLLEKALEGQKIDLGRLNVTACIEDNETIKKFIGLNMGVSLMSELAVKADIDQGTLKGYKIKDLDLQRKFYFVFHKKRPLSPLAETFKNFVIESIKEGFLYK